MRLPDERQLLEDLAHARGQAKSARHLIALYGLKGRERVALRRLLNRLVTEGKLVRLRGPQRYGLPRAAERVTGLLRGTSKGHAFVWADDTEQPDVFVSRDDLAGALHGDQVEVALHADSDPERPAGRIVRLVKRADSRIVGLFLAGSSDDRRPHRLRPFDPRIGARIVIPDRFSLGAEHGDFVDTVLLRDDRHAPREGAPLRARVTAVLGQPDDRGTDVAVILRSYRLADEHSATAVAEAEARAARGITADELAGRRDLRSLRTVTIDGETARDFDDAVSVESGGDVSRVWVHIADVAAHVEEGTTLDAEAQERATSVYFPDRAVHMLPEALSAGACSLRPNEDRLAVSIRLDVDRAGCVVSSEACETVIRSDRRMTYTEMKRLLVDGDPALRSELRDFVADFELLARVAGDLIRAREARGGLDFDLPVPIVVVDEDGWPTEIVESERNVAHRLIEELMIAANSAVARRLVEAGEPAVHRNHASPPGSAAEGFREAAAVFGHDLGGGDSPSPKDFQAVLRSAEGRPEEELLTMLALRAMARAEYGVEPEGHYGLALTHYTHFTSPIRRYPDLIVHRALRRLLRGEGTAEGDRADVSSELADLAEHCSEAERNAEAAERALLDWKKAVFMVDHVGEEFSGRITGITDFGIFVRLDAHHVEGLVRLQDLRDDRWERDDQGVRLVGRHTRRVLRLGDAFRVRVKEVDVFRRRIDLEEP